MEEQVDKPIPCIKRIHSCLYSVPWKAKLAFGIVFNYTKLKCVWACQNVIVHNEFIEYNNYELSN